MVKTAYQARHSRSDVIPRHAPKAHGSSYRKTARLRHAHLAATSATARKACFRDTPTASMDYLDTKDDTGNLLLNRYTTYGKLSKPIISESTGLRDIPADATLCFACMNDTSKGSYSSLKNRTPELVAIRNSCRPDPPFGTRRSSPLSVACADFGRSVRPPPIPNRYRRSGSVGFRMSRNVLSTIYSVANKFAVSSAPKDTSCGPSPALPPESANKEKQGTSASIAVSCCRENRRAVPDRDHESRAAGPDSWSRSTRPRRRGPEPHHRSGLRAPDCHPSVAHWAAP